MTPPRLTPEEMHCTLQLAALVVRDGIELMPHEVVSQSRALLQRTEEIDRAEASREMRRNAALAEAADACRSRAKSHHRDKNPVAANEAGKCALAIECRMRVLEQFDQPPAAPQPEKTNG